MGHEPKLPKKLRELAAVPAQGSEAESGFLLDVADRVEFLEDALRIARTTMSDYGIEWADSGKITKLPHLVHQERFDEIERKGKAAEVRVADLEQLYEAACGRLVELGETEVPLVPRGVGAREDRANPRPSAPRPEEAPPADGVGRRLLPGSNGVCEKHGETLVQIWRCEEPANMNGAPRSVCPECIEERAEKVERSLAKINDIRDSIVGSGTVNWSEHVYPLVAVLDEAGFEGKSHEEVSKDFGTVLERLTKLEARYERLKILWRTRRNLFRTEREVARLANDRANGFFERWAAVVALARDTLRPFARLFETSMHEVMIDNVMLTRADARAAFDVLTKCDRVAQLTIDVTSKAEEWVDGWNGIVPPEYGIDNIDVLRAHCEKMRALALALKDAVEARRVGLRDEKGETT